MIRNDYEGSRVELISLLAEQGEEPAFLRRHRKVVEAQQKFWNVAFEKHRQLRGACEDLLAIVNEKVTGEWEGVADLLIQPSDWRILEQWWIGWEMPERTPLPHPYADQWLWSRQRALRKLLHAGKRFNATWELYVDTMDLDSINGIIDAYNQFYPLEKSCAFGIEDVSRLGFQELTKIERSQIRERFPRLEIPELRRHRLFRGNWG
ncbi:MAG: hypothetical protein AAF394_18670 [Planctomycetota bacterium]